MSDNASAMGFFACLWYQTYWRKILAFTHYRYLSNLFLFFFFIEKDTHTHTLVFCCYRYLPNLFFLMKNINLLYAVKAAVTSIIRTDSRFCCGFGTWFKTQLAFFLFSFQIYEWAFLQHNITFIMKETTPVWTQEHKDHTQTEQWTHMKAI